MKRPLTCPAASFGNCVGTDSILSVGGGKLKLVAAKPRRFGKAGFTIAPGKSRKVTIKLSRAAQKLLARVHTLEVRELVVAHDSRGETTRTTGRLILSG